MKLGKTRVMWLLGSGPEEGNHGNASSTGNASGPRRSKRRGKKREALRKEKDAEMQGSEDSDADSSHDEPLKEKEKKRSETLKFLESIKGLREGKRQKQKPWRTANARDEEAATWILPNGSPEWMKGWMDRRESGILHRLRWVQHDEDQPKNWVSDWINQAQKTCWKLPGAGGEVCFFFGGRVFWTSMFLDDLHWGVPLSVLCCIEMWKQQDSPTPFLRVTAPFRLQRCRCLFVACQVQLPVMLLGCKTENRRIDKSNRLFSFSGIQVGVDSGDFIEMISESSMIIIRSYKLIVSWKNNKLMIINN